MDPGCELGLRELRAAGAPHRELHKELALRDRGDVEGLEQVRDRTHRIADGGEVPRVVDVARGANPDPDFGVLALEAKYLDIGDDAADVDLMCRHELGDLHMDRLVAHKDKGGGRRGTLN